VKDPRAAATPRGEFSPHEGRLLKALLWAIGALFLAIMAWTWIAAERAAPVLLDLETGKPVEQRPAL
jgi:hypothetical protein